MTNFIGMLIGLFSALAGLAGIIGGILLIVAGEWSLLFYLIVASVVAPFAMAIPMLPGALFALPAVLLDENGYHFLSKVFAWFSSLYLGLVFAVWSSYVFIYVMNSTETFWGGVFASFGTAISPIVFMASKEPIEDALDSVNQTLVMLTAQIALLFMIVMGVLSGGTVYELGTFYFTAFAVLSAASITFVSMMFKSPND